MLPLTEDLLHESPCGFRTSRGITDMIFAACQIEEKCWEQNKDLYMAFIDPTKAFNPTNREALGTVLSRFGCPANFITILRLLHDKTTAIVLINEIETEPFTIRTGVTQGCVIAPTLFTSYLFAILFVFLDRLPRGAEIDYRLDGKLFNLTCVVSRPNQT